MVWLGKARYSYSTFQGAVRYGLVLWGTVRHGKARIISYSIQFEIFRSGSALSGGVWRGKARQGIHTHGIVMSGLVG